jgi:acetyl-CoA acetyltransferase
MSLRDRCAIVGVGNTAYTRGTDRSNAQLHLEASLKALDDAGLRPQDIDGILPNEVSGVCTEELMVNLGLTDLSFSATVRSGGASFVASILDACAAIDAGVASCVLMTAGRRGYSAQRISQNSMRGPRPTSLTMPPALASVAEFERPYGSVGPAQMYAQAAQRHMYEYGTTSEHFGHVAVACRKHANLNPQALMHEKPMTLEDHQSSRLITTPFRMFDCSLESDGAGAILVTSAERARDLAKSPVLVAGIGEGHGNPPTSITQKRDMAFIEGVHTAGRRAFAMAGLGPADVDCAQLHDPFTWLVVGELEALGFCEVGEGGPFVENGRIELGGDLPVNTHGGLLSEAHVSGVGHVIEAVRQLRGEVEPQRQVPDCNTVLVNNEGDMHEGAVAILRRDV